MTVPGAPAAPDTDLSLFRVYYDPAEIAPDGYPFRWANRSVRRDGVLLPAHSMLVPPFDEVVLPIKDIIREQAGHRCIRCGHPYVVGSTPGEWSPCDELCQHGGPVEISLNDGEAWVENDKSEIMMCAAAENLDVIRARWRVLTVHHLNGVKHDCRWWNLVSLCQVCHLVVQARVRMEQVYPHPHTEWFRPYAAGYYAWAYSGLNLTREETMLRLDELLALELDPAY